MLNRLWDEFNAVTQLKPLLLIMLAVPAVFYATSAAMAEVWMVNETFTHGFLILPISLWLIWQQRGHIAAIPIGTDWRALILLAPALGAWLAAALIDVAVVQQLAMVALVPLTVWLLMGSRIVLALLFPLLYLFFAVPLGQSLIPPMMEFTADFTVSMVQYSGIPIYRDGLSFELPSGSWSVVEECSGVRYLIASAALGTIYAYLTYQSLTKRAIFILASLLVPILANGLRAYGIVMIGHLSGMKYAVGADHLLYGWVFFGIVIFALFWVGGFWADAQPAPTDGEAAARADDRWPAASTAGLVFAALLAINLAVMAVKATEVHLPATATLNLPARAGALQSVTDENADRWRPVIVNPDRLAAASYAIEGSRVALDIGYFHAQRDGAEAISSLNRLANPYSGDWKLTASRSYRSDSLTVRESELRLRDRAVMVWSGYLVGGKLYASPYLAKVVQGLNLLRGQHHAAFITLSTPRDADVEVLRSRLEPAWNALRTPVANAVDELAQTHR